MGRRGFDRRAECLSWNGVYPRSKVARGSIRRHSFSRSTVSHLVQRPGTAAVGRWAHLACEGRRQDRAALQGQFRFYRPAGRGRGPQNRTFLRTALLEIGAGGDDYRADYLSGILHLNLKNSHPSQVTLLCPINIGHFSSCSQTKNAVKFASEVTTYFLDA